MLAWVRTPSGATCNSVPQLGAAFIDTKNMCLASGSSRMSLPS